MYRNTSIFSRKWIISAEPLRFLAPVFLAWTLLTASLQAASPRDEALRLVPEDFGLCLVIQDLRGQSEALAASPFLERFLASPPGLALKKSDEVRKLADLKQVLKKHLDLSWEQLRDDILGDVVILAYRPPPVGQPDQEEGLFLLRARDPVLLKRVLEKLNTVQKQSGELKEFEILKYQGVDYYRRVDRAGTHFGYLHGSFLVFSAQEKVIHKVIDSNRCEAGKESLLSRQFRQVGTDRSLATLWINPRSFEPELEHKSAQAKGGEVVVLKRILGYWKALDGMMATVTPNKNDIELALVLLARDGEQSPPANRLFSGNLQASELWARFPDNALLTVAGRVDTKSLAEFLGEFLPEDARRALRETAEHSAGSVLGLDVVDDVLPNIGPDWGFCLLSPPKDDKAPFPGFLTAFRVRPGSKDKPVDRALMDGLNAFAAWVVIGYNSSHPHPLNIRSVKQDKVEVKYLSSEKGLPPGFEPACALKDGYLLLASSPALIGRFPVSSEVPRQTSEIPLLRLSLRELRSFMKARQEVFITQIAARHVLSAQEAAERMNGLLSISELFEKLELSQRSESGRATLLLRLRTEFALRK